MIEEQQVRNTVALAYYDNSWYSTGAGGFKRTVWFVINALFFINPLNPSSGLKIFLLRLFGAKIGKGVVIKPAVNIKYPWHLNIGNFVWIGEKVWLDSLTEILIEDNVVVSQGAMLQTGSHDYTKAGFDLMVDKIHLEEGVWIGARAIVCPGVVCASHSVLAAGSIAAKALKPYTIYQGNPAEEKRMRQIR